MNKTFPNAENLISWRIHQLLMDNKEALQKQAEAMQSNLF